MGFLGGGPGTSPVGATPPAANPMAGKATPGMPSPMAGKATPGVPAPAPAPVTVSDPVASTMPAAIPSAATGNNAPGIVNATQIDPSQGWGDSNLTVIPPQNDLFGSGVKGVTLPPNATAPVAPTAPAPTSPTPIAPMAPAPMASASGVPTPISPQMPTGLLAPTPGAGYSQFMHRGMNRAQRLGQALGGYTPPANITPV